MKRPLTLLLVLAACAPNQGEVFQKKHDPAHTSYHYAPIVGGKGGGVLVPTQIGERFKILIRDADGSTGTVLVTRDLWERIKVGDHWHKDMTYEEVK